MFRTSQCSRTLQVSKDDILGLSEPLPAPGLLDAHRDLLNSFIKNSHALVSLLLSLLNHQLGLPHGQLSSLHRLASVSGDQVRWVHAPPQPRDDRRTALGQHTDFGSVTVLFNRLGGLQVLPPSSSEWSYVKPLRGHAVINLGDAIVKFSAGILRSNIHRVVNPPGQQADHTRMSLVYFARPADNVILKALHGSTLIDERRRQDPERLDEEGITSKEWILRRALGRRQGGDWTKAGGTDSARLG
jgi:isopenicillin N synthase-like dioxygenase